MPSLHVHKGDTVLVIAGKDKGAKGKVLATAPGRDRVLVEGINEIKKHTKVTSTGRGGLQGGIVHQEAPIHVSNVMVVCPHCDKASRVRHRKDEAGRNVRVCHRCGQDL